jgi:hypothetical protein
MSAMSEMARSKAKAKAERLVRSNTGDIDASGWREPLGEKGDIQTGPRVVSRQHFKAGGKVAGLAGVAHAGRKPRGSKELLEQADAGMKAGQASWKNAGGRTARASGGKTLINDWVNSDVKAANESRPGEKHDGGMARGGHVKGCDCAKCSGGRVGKAAGGALNGGTRPAGGRLARKSGGSAKKGMNVNIIIAPSQGPKPMMPPPGAMPPGGPVGMHQGAPPPMMPPGAGAPPPAGAPPMMGRARGGRTSGMTAKPGKYPLKDGGGGGLGRLEKIKGYGSNA